MTAEIWHPAWVIIIQADNFPPSLQHVRLLLGLDRPWVCSFQRSSCSIPRPFSSLLFSPRCVPFIHPLSASPWGSTATANLIKRTTIKIRLNYCKAAHWHPRSILNKKKKRRASNRPTCSQPTWGAWVKRDRPGRKVSVPIRGNGFSRMHVHFSWMSA